MGEVTFFSRSSSVKIQLGRKRPDKKKRKKTHA